MLLTVDLNEGPTDYGSLLGCGTRARSGTLTWAVLVEHLGAGSALDAIGVPTRADDGDVRDSGVVLTQLCERHPGVATVVGGVPLDRRDCGAQALLRGRGSGRIGWRRRGSRHDRAACAASAFSDRSGRAVVVDERLECALDAVATPRRLANDDVLERTVVRAPELGHRHPCVGPVVRVVRLDRRDCRDHFEPTDLEGTRAGAGGRSERGATGRDAIR